MFEPLINSMRVRFLTSLTESRTFCSGATTMEASSPLPGLRSRLRSQQHSSPESSRKIRGIDRKHSFIQGNVKKRVGSLFLDRMLIATKVLTGVVLLGNFWLQISLPGVSEFLGRFYYLNKIDLKVHKRYRKNSLLDEK